MKRVYTDERFPGCEIVNDGSLAFQVFLNGVLDHTFTTWERAETGIKRPDDNTTSEPFAKQRAQEFFDRLAKMTNDSALDLPEPEGELEPDDMPDQLNVTTSIDDLMAKEKLETDPTRKKVLRAEIMKLMRQEGSVAVAVVNDLIAG